MPVLKHISPPVVPRAPNARPLNEVPSASSNQAGESVVVEVIEKTNCANLIKNVVF
jgi:hypothetical protein